MALSTRRAFTLTELMVAVAVMIAVIVATSRIFGTATTVAGVGEATLDILQEAAAIERRLRSDLEKLSREGFLAIRSVAVQNDVRVGAGGTLLDPTQPPDEIIRADQLVFFSQGLQNVQTYRVGGGTFLRAQGAVSRVYYGPAFQAPLAPGVESDDSNYLAIDPRYFAAQPVVPWHTGAHTFVKTRFQQYVGSGGDYTIDGVFGSIDMTQPPAVEWLLARQPVVLADDGGEPAVFLYSQYGGARSARSIFLDDPAYSTPTPEVRNGRVDAAASELHEVRRAVLDADANGIRDPWADQRDAMAAALYYPRAERVAPSMHRIDQALTNHVLARGCSSFIVDWTYADGTGGVAVPSSGEQPWFGLDAAGRPGASRGVTTLGNYVLGQPTAVDPDVLEAVDPPDTVAGQAIQSLGAVVYEAVFGYNQDLPLDTSTYTPWPSAIRVTMVLHDPESRLGGGREIQFVIDLPGRD